jgi:hypothetical protein
MAILVGMQADEGVRPTCELKFFQRLAGAFPSVPVGMVVTLAP